MIAVGLDLGVMVVALAAILVAMAAHVLYRQFLHQTFGGGRLLRLVTGRLDAWANGIIQRVVTHVRAWGATAVVQPTRLFNRMATLSTRGEDLTNIALHNVSEALGRVPTAVENHVTYVTNRYIVNSPAVQVPAGIRHLAGEVFAHGRAIGALQYFHRRMRGEIHALQQRVAQGSRTVIEQVANPLTGRVQMLQQAVDAANARADAVENALNRDVTALRREIAAVSQTNVTAAVDQARQTILTDVHSLLGQQEAATAIQIAAVSRVASRADAVALDATRWIDRCGDPLCQNLGHTATRMGNLNRLLTDGALAEMLAAMVADPQKAATEMREFVMPIARPIIDRIQKEVPR